MRFSSQVEVKYRKLFDVMDIVGHDVFPSKVCIHVGMR